MFLYEVIFTTDKTINNFGSKTASTIFCKVIISFTKCLVSRHIAENISCHFQSVANLDAVREEETACALCYPSLSCIQSAIIKAHIVGVNFGDTVFFDVGKQSLSNLCKRSQSALVALYIFPILRDFLCVVCRPHQFFFGTKNICIYKRAGSIHFATLIDNSPPYIISPHIRGEYSVNIFVNRASLGVDYKFVTNSLIHNFDFLSVPYIYYYSTVLRNVNPFFNN